MYLGLDLAAKKANWAIWHEGKLVEEGEVTTVAFPKLLERLNPVACAMEFTGRLAAQWALMAWKEGTESFIVHTNHRAAMVRLSDQTHKTDEEDARGIARYLYLWHDEKRREALDLPKNLFTDYRVIHRAWELRGLVADTNKLNQLRMQARQRIGAAERAEQEERKKPWEELSTSKAPEEALELAVAFCRSQFPQELNSLLSMPRMGERLAVTLLGELMPIDRFEMAREEPDKTISRVRKYLRWSPIREQTGTTMNRTRRSNMRANPVVGMMYFTCIGFAREDAIGTFPKMYRDRIARAMPKGEAIRRVTDAYMRCCVAILRSGALWRGESAPKKEKALTRSERRPAHLITQTEAAKIMGVSKQYVAQIVKSGVLRAEEHEGKWHPILKYVELWEPKAKKKPAAGAEE